MADSVEEPASEEGIIEYANLQVIATLGVHVYLPLFLGARCTYYEVVIY